MNKNGFTLIELLITIAIVGILAGVAVTAYVGVTKKAARAEAYADLESIRLLQEQFYADNGDYIDNSWYLATPDIDDGGIEDALPGFKPGGGVNYRYRTWPGQALDNPSTPTWFGDERIDQDPCFIAFANGIAGTRAEGDLFVIDCNNERNW
jgi:prepilin-type N-terminal cleavage/methylation domain-containing protein